MVRTASALALLLLATACHRPAAVATPQADSMDAVFSRLSAKCGQSVPELQQLVQQGAERVREQRQIPMQADLFAVVLDHSTPPAPNALAARRRWIRLSTPSCRDTRRPWAAEGTELSVALCRPNHALQATKGRPSFQVLA